MANRIARKSDMFILKLIGLMIAFCALVLSTAYLLPIVTPTLRKIIPILAILALAYIVMTAASLIYVNVKREKLYKQNKQECDKCIKESNRIIDNSSNYYAYIEELGLRQTIRCSSSTVSNAASDEVKYVLKYSDIDYSLEDLERIDFLKQFQTDYGLFIRKIDNCKKSIIKIIPLIFRPFISRKRIAYIICKIDYEITKIKCPKLHFLYVSPAGKSSREFTTAIDIEMLELLSDAISERINKKGHSKRQRGAMTNDLREAIKQRDNYTCQKCGNSVYKEPNLLLEVDHIIPIAKGGKTEANNLQTLCWRCNREKGKK